MEQRTAQNSRTTKETEISVSLTIDGTGKTEISTGIPFFDHMLDQLGRHSGFDLAVDAKGDLEIDAHHTVEDVGIAIGECFKEAIGDKAGVQRFATAACPLDEALVEVALDLSGRPFLHYEIDPPGQKILSDPPFDPQLVEEFWRAFVSCADVTVHQVLVRGKNTHHIIESLFKKHGPCPVRCCSSSWKSNTINQGCSINMPTIAVLDYGIGNLRSAQKALESVGGHAILTSEAEVVRKADGVVLPGVGNFGKCVDALRTTGVDKMALDAIESQRPFLGICIGMQLLFEKSEESPKHRGLGVLPGEVRILPESVKRPQMQWNAIHVPKPIPMLNDLDGKWFYFVHSYAADLSQPMR